MKKLREIFPKQEWLLCCLIVGLCVSFAGNAQTDPNFQTPTFVKIASWNIRIFSNNRTDDQLRSICKVAKNYDFLAIIELRDEQVLQRMVAMLQNEFGRTYSYQLSPPVGTSSQKELYAFLYDRKFISVVKPGQTFQDQTFIRFPYYATFRAGCFDFTVVVCHIIWGDSVEERRKEIKRLAEVYRQVQDSDPYENDVITLGDFNREPTDDLAWGPLKSFPSMVHTLDLPLKSMIWDSNLYDNMWFPSNYVREYTLDKGINHFDETDFNNDDQTASRDVSDHRPVWGLFRITGPDDD